MLAGEARRGRNRLRSITPRLTRQAVAKHLGSLGDAGLVSVTRRGREARYELTPEPLTAAVGWNEQVGSQWEVRLDALRRHLAGSR